MISKEFHNKGLKEKVDDLIHGSCENCQKTKYNKSVKAPLEGIDVKNVKSLCSIDLYGPLRAERGGVNISSYT